MTRAKLTALAVERAHRSGEPVLLSDGDGLYLRKQTHDGASWTLRYRFAGREHWLTLGNYPDTSLAQARIESRQARVLLDRQQNPLSVRRAALAQERQQGSFKALEFALLAPIFGGSWMATTEYRQAPGAMVRRVRHRRGAR
jgi:hypothetical protein